ncbi:hypothetical protein X962_5897 [Burkholderia pseudomallei MSHR7343]|nr:hypothetical protein X962_5897 [Burkholderia pseudomallei MSHR7343]
MVKASYSCTTSTSRTVKRACRNARSPDAFAPEHTRFSIWLMLRCVTASPTPRT